MSGLILQDLERELSERNEEVRQMRMEGNNKMDAEVSNSIHMQNFFLSQAIFVNWADIFNLILNKEENILVLLENSLSHHH